jgi:hypothetical protein
VFGLWALVAVALAGVILGGLAGFGVHAATDGDGERRIGRFGPGGPGGFQGGPPHGPGGPGQGLRDGQLPQPPQGAPSQAPTQAPSQDS